jgi:hypothetical protein
VPALLDSMPRHLPENGVDATEQQRRGRLLSRRKVTPRDRDAQRGEGFIRAAGG